MSEKRLPVNRTFPSRFRYVLMGAILGGSAGFAFMFVMLILVVSGGGAAQGIADMEVGYSFILYSSIIAFAVGWFRLIKSINEPEPASGKGIEPSDNLA